MLPKKVLIIDDEKMIRLTTGILIKKKGMEVAEASSGEQGLAMLKEASPDLVLLDIMMPIMDGWEVLKRIRADEKYSRIPVVIFTAMDYVEAQKRAKEAGVEKILRKPFHIDELATILDMPDKGEVYANQQ